jgi:hypothetical protein
MRIACVLGSATDQISPQIPITSPARITNDTNSLTMGALYPILTFQVNTKLPILTLYLVEQAGDKLVKNSKLTVSPARANRCLSLSEVRLGMFRTPNPSSTLVFRGGGIIRDNAPLSMKMPGEPPKHSPKKRQANLSL